MNDEECFESPTQPYASEIFVNPPARQIKINDDYATVPSFIPISSNHVPFHFRAESRTKSLKVSTKNQNNMRLRSRQLSPRMTLSPRLSVSAGSSFPIRVESNSPIHEKSPIKKLNEDQEMKHLFFPVL